MKACGPGNILWGTDSIWYGSPQDQIQAFRAFQIAPQLRDKHGYAEITPAVRANIFGLNALKIYPLPEDVLKTHVKRDKIALDRATYRAERPDPSFLTHGPKTRREFLNLKAWGG
jgi:hypothetical protein